MICPYPVDTIVVFTHYVRRERYIARIRPLHIQEYHLNRFSVTEATIEQKAQWYHSDCDEFLLEKYLSGGVYR